MVTSSSNGTPPSFPLSFPSSAPAWASLWAPPPHLAPACPIVSGLVQTIFGLLSDRMRHANALVVTSSILAAVSLALLPFARSFGWLLLIFTAIALSLAMFHPQGAAGTSQLSSTNKGRFMSVFNFGGSMGSFVGSLTVIPLLGLLHLERFWILAIPGIALAFFQVFALPRQEDPEAVATNGNGGRMTDSPAFKGYLMLVANSTLTAMVYNGVTILLPLLFQELGFLPGKAGVYLAVGSLVGSSRQRHRGRTLRPHRPQDDQPHRGDRRSGDAPDVRPDRVDQHHLVPGHELLQPASH